MSFVEKSDVDISKLFHWSDKFSIKDNYGKEIIEVYIRIVGDAELNRARIAAIRSSRELRTLLKDKNSDERIAFIPLEEDLTKEQIIELILLLMVKEFAQQSAKEIVLPVPTEPRSEASLEMQERYQSEVDNYEPTRQEKIRESVNAKLNSYRKALKSWGNETLFKEYERLLINDLCEQEMMKIFRETCAFYGSYKDPDFKERAFNDFETFKNLPTEIIEQFVSNYQGLEINIDFLKKSLEATQ